MNLKSKIIEIGHEIEARRRSERVELDQKAAAHLAITSGVLYRMLTMAANNDEPSRTQLRELIHRTVADAATLALPR